MKRKKEVINREALDVEGFNAFQDSYSKAIISRDSDSLQKHKLAKQKRKKEYDEMQSLKNEVAELKSMMIEILKSKQQFEILKSKQQ